MKASKNILVVVILALAFISCKNEAQPEIKTVGEVANTVDFKLDPNATYAKAEFTIEGMTCQIGCANKIQKQIAKMEGVKSAKVDFKNKLAMVEFDDAKQNTKSIETTITNVAKDYNVTDAKTVDAFKTED